MPEIKIKHVVSFSSEDSVHKAENLLKPETYRKWKCAAPGDKNAVIILQFEKSSQIQSIDIGNENSAFVEILVDRSSNAVNDYQVLLTASSFMSPLESRNGNNANRVRMFTSDKLVQNSRTEKWDLVKIVCSQPFNKNIQYGLSFIKFHSPADPNDETAATQKNELKLGAFKLKEELDEDDDPMPVGKWFSKRNEKSPLSSTSPAAIRQASYAANVLESNSPPLMPKQILKRKIEDDDQMSQLPSKKKESTITHVNRDKVVLRTVDTETSSTNPIKTDHKQKFDASSSSAKLIAPVQSKIKKKKKKEYNKIMDKVVFVLSGYQNPKRSTIRDQALEMGAKYKGDWDSTCTHLVCAFINTPKYGQVMKKGGRIITEKWIFDCYKKKELLPWRKYMLGKYSKSTTEESSSEEECEPVPPTKLNGTYVSPVKVLDLPLTSTVQKPETSTVPKPDKTTEVQEREERKNDEVSTDAESDYVADTDVDESSGGDTEDEIRRVEQHNKMQDQRSPKKIGKTNDKPKEINDVPPEELLSNKMQNAKRSPRKQKSPNKINNSNRETDEPENSKVKSPSSEIPNTDDLPLPVLPDFFKSKRFHLYGDFSDDEKHKLLRYIVAYNGQIEELLNSQVKYIVTSSKWSEKFEDALSDNEDLIFVRPQWIYKCHEKEKCIPYQPYIVIPDT